MGSNRAFFFRGWLGHALPGYIHLDGPIPPFFGFVRFFGGLVGHSWAELCMKAEDVTRTGARYRSVGRRAFFAAWRLRAVGPAAGESVGGGHEERVRALGKALGRIAWWRSKEHICQGRCVA